MQMMLEQVDSGEFQPINQGYNSVFHLNRLSLGIVVPLEAYAHGPVPVSYTNLRAHDTMTGI